MEIIFLDMEGTLTTEIGPFDSYNELEEAMLVYSININVNNE